MHQNVQGIKGKDLQVDLCLVDNNIDIMCVTESWLSGNEVGIYNIGEYKVISSSHRKNYIRGGTMIYVRKSWRAKNRPDIVNMTVEKEFEVSCVELGALVVLCVYRSPSANLENFSKKLEICLDMLTKNSNKTIIVCGDFNVHFSTTRDESHALSDVMNSFMLKQQIFNYTRITKETKSCIDNMFSNKEATEASIVTNGIKSDHYGQIIKVQMNIDKVEEGKSVTSRVVTKRRLEELNAALNREYQALDKNLNFSSFFTSFMRCANSYIPITNKKVCQKKQFNDWATKGIRISKEKLFMLYELLKINKRDALRQYVTKYSKIFKQVSTIAKKKYLSDRIISSKNKIKTVWNVIKEETGNYIEKANCTIEINVSKESSLKEGTQVANHFNKYFCTVADNLTKNLNSSKEKALEHLQVYCNRVKETVDFCEVSQLEVKCVIAKLKSKTSKDLWHMSPKLLKSLSNAIVEPLTIVINECLQTGTFPDLLKIARVIPLHKKGCHKDIQNYRPVSLLPIFSKVFEKILEIKITKFLNHHNIINYKQFGFQKGKSTGDAMTEMFKGILKSLDETQHTFGLFCDLSKAFDCVNHDILLIKLDHYGIRGKELGILKSYLGNRSQVCEVSGAKSEPLIIKIGIPQGSILGPLLFLIYINDLSGCINDDVEIVMFADDISFIISLKDIASLKKRMEDTLRQLNTWFETNNLLLNVNKTNIMHFALGSHRRANETFVTKTIQEQSLNVVSEIIFLGLIFDNQLNWKAHIDRLAGKLSSACYAIKKIRELCGFDAAKAVYFAYFDSLMSYGLILWGTAAEVNRIFTLQKRAVRCVLNMKNTDTCRETFNKVGILTLTSAYVYQNLIYTKKYMQENHFHSDTHTHNTRNKHNIEMVGHRLAKTSKSFVCNSARFFNKLPMELRNMDYEQFKLKVKTMLIKKSYYTIKEALNDRVDMSNFLFDS